MLHSLAADSRSTRLTVGLTVGHCTDHCQSIVLCRKQRLVWCYCYSNQPVVDTPANRNTALLRGHNAIGNCRDTAAQESVIAHYNLCHLPRLSSNSTGPFLTSCGRLVVDDVAQKRDRCTTGAKPENPVDLPRLSAISGFTKLTARVIWLYARPFVDRPLCNKGLFDACR